MSQTSGPRARFLDALRGTGTSASIELTELAKKYGVTTEYISWKGEPTRVSANTVRAVLTALGAEVDTPEQVERSLEGFDDLSWRQLIPPSLVIREGSETWVPVTLPVGATARLWIELDEDPLLQAADQGDSGIGRVGRVEVGVLTGADGDRRRVDGAELVRVYRELPRDLPLGWHKLRIQIEDGAAG
ncbi:MAG: hypothetical protein LBG11_01265, partial [Bifidobacteriaceae bacterium]|nr:hypothetical protein [Bifidobacteriaceae bacterium]